MFRDFANVWTIVGLARDLVKGKPQPLRVAGQRIVFFRDAEGKPVALVDICPHRGVALSLGSVKDGVIQCPFHGWRFDGAGKNLGVPWNPDAKCDTLGATALPAREGGGLLWLYTGFDPDGEPHPSSSLGERIRLFAQSVTWRAHWTRVMENMLDQPHLPFVHKRTIGRGLIPLVDKRMDVICEEVDYGLRVSNKIDGEKRPGLLDYRYPNAMELHIDPPGKILRLFAVCQPLDEDTTKLTIYTLRDFARAPIFDAVFGWLNRRIAEEDRAIVESSLPPSAPPPEEERSVRTDAPTLAFRRLYRQRLLGTNVVEREI